MAPHTPVMEHHQSPHTQQQLQLHHASEETVKGGGGGSAVAVVPSVTATAQPGSSSSSLSLPQQQQSLSPHPPGTSSSVSDSSSEQQLLLPHHQLSRSLGPRPDLIPNGGDITTPPDTTISTSSSPGVAQHQNGLTSSTVAGAMTVGTMSSSWSPSPSSAPPGPVGRVPTSSKVKCVLIGDGAVGKTSLIVSYTTNGYPTEYMPTAFDDYSVVVTVDSKPVQLQLCDTAGQDDFDTIRPLCYPSTDIFLLCFSVVSPTSFNNVQEKWVPEVRRHRPRAPFILVGTQCDLRNDVKVLIELAQYREKPVSEAEAARLAREIGAVGYVECSALTQKNLKDVFDQAILASLAAAAASSSSSSPSSSPSFFSRAGQVRKSNRKKYALAAGSEGCGTGGGASLKKAGWKRFCCFL